jgi:D-beta-D-heptose 7-phosphate kinase/D-beta-D-heptose 1-phosphate adenosyltransferase
MNKILVIGDSCIDIFRYGVINRLAPEAPIPVINPEYERSTPGMAGNVARNIEALGFEVDFITNKSEIRKIRYVCSKYNQLVLRVDENDKCEQVRFTTLKNINYSDYDAVVVSDYCKGFLEEEDIEFISKSHPLTFLDTKKILGDWAHNFSFIKINGVEFDNNLEVLKKDIILQNKIVVTKGKHGCEYQGVTYPTQEVPVKDISGAGDTFLAGLVTEYTRSKNINVAINFAQECTTVVVQKSGVSTI